jgi:hypothetical protein
VKPTEEELNLSLLSEFLHQVAPKDGWGTAFVTSGLGAFVGGWVASRAFTKRAVVSELNAISAALTLCFAICNKFISVKSQHVSGMKRRYEEQRKEFEEHLKRPQQTRGQFVLAANYHVLTPILAPIDELKKAVFEKTSVRGRALVALVELATCIAGWHQAVKTQDDLASEIRNRSGKTPEEVVAKYFGIRDPNGHIDERYRTTIDAICLQTDDAIFFSRVLASDLVRYGNSVRRRHMWRYWLWLPKMQDADWSKVREAGLMPEDASYERWSGSFRKLTFWQKISLTLLP